MVHEELKLFFFVLLPFSGLHEIKEIKQRYMHLMLWMIAFTCKITSRGNLLVLKSEQQSLPLKRPFIVFFL